MSLPTEGPGGRADLLGTPDREPGVGRRIRQPKRDTGRFSLLLIDNATGKATRVNVRPLTVEGIMRSALNDRRLASGYLWLQLVEAAKRLWPEFETESSRIVGYPLPPRRVQEPTQDGPFVPRWRRWLDHKEDDNEDT